MDLILGGLAVFTAAFLSGVVGFAYGLVALPLLLLVGLPLELVVPVNLSTALVARLLVVRLGWREVTWPRATRLGLASVPGAALGVVVASVVAQEHLQTAAGVLVLVAVAAIAAGGHRQQRAPRGSRRPTSAVSAAADLTAGSAGGFLGSITSLNGVPPALLMTLRRVPGPNVVADLAVYFIVGNLATLVLLELAGRVLWTEVLPFLVLWIPVALLGTRCGTWVGPRLPATTFRRLTLAIVVLSACVGLIDGLTA